MNETVNSIIERAASPAKHFLLAVAVLMIGAVAASLVKAYSSWLPPEIFSVSGVVLFLMIILRWAILTEEEQT